MIEIKNITKQFGDFTAVNDLSFTIKPGEVVGFLGPNGAGKSTTMKMLTGFLDATSGAIWVNGFDIKQSPIDVKKLIGYLPEGAPAYGDMTPAQFLNFIADIRGLTGRKKQARLARVIKSVELQSVLDKPIDNLSKGFKRRVGLAQAILHDPKVLILDEPTDGLDPNQKHQVRELIQKMAKDKIVIVSTHILEEVTAVCNRAVIIANGQKIFDGTPNELQNKSSFHNAVTIETSSSNIDKDQFKSLNDIAAVEVSGNMVTIKPQNGQNIFNQVYKFIQNENIEIDAIYSEKGRLDDIFRELTSNSEIVK
ncbi:ABC transporter ATP-binding protein [Psychrosphaera sp. B3R10]|uniref:ABC transporter ATP-binding protein n=1 Tax=unclassified Psychrosphaera TaxID=2641570 RepID=UPI001C0A6451|nr:MULTISPECIES: ABC transporter ATP-binding protein [unclassified Psychrosphaera]MBU2881136.1 ABC transporter ATP-binding protein [Psychrosphaera sp. I2R16]MBU2988241.1 ABC transporter ATP-binding protein [Psychrosphaera sp. B3R10]MDO6718450.1 ABC transporter ATP-binding protein [Psychrosphaera sp. 1_MG-2023]